MYLLTEPEDTKIEIKRETIIAYENNWEQERNKNKRVPWNYVPIELDKLGEYRSSRWYTSFRFPRKESYSDKVDRGFF